MECLANALTGSGDYAAALPLYEEHLATNRRVNSDLHYNTLASIFNLARLHVHMKNPSLALPLMHGAGPRAL